MNQFGLSKAETLNGLNNKFPSFTLPVLIVKYCDFLEDPGSVINSINKLFSERLVIRSSFSGEDSQISSNAGAFHSEVDVKNGRQELLSSIGSVFASYPTLNSHEHVFVQDYLTNVKFSGVLMTREHTSGAPYYVINYHEGSDTTDVTSGKSNQVKRLVIHRDHTFLAKFDWVQDLLESTQKVEKYLDSSWLDIEFAHNGNSLFILQARPIVRKEKSITDSSIATELVHLKKYFCSMQKDKYSVVGAKTIFGNMPDWNPAEIIGVQPKPFSYSLYKEIITDETWAYQRSNYGYKNVRSNNLMPLLSGKPYIDTRISFTSFLPADTDQSTAEKLLEFYMKKLSKSPHLQDKVEFDIVFSTYDFDILERISEVDTLSETERNAFVFQLWKLTQKVLFSNDKLFEQDIDKIKCLGVKLDTVLKSDFSIEEKIFWLLQDLKRYGTLPFAGLARAAFMAVSFLKSLERIGAISQDEYSSFHGSLKTVSKELVADTKILAKEEFLNKYGHLRPKTYDINSPNYSENFEEYFPHGMPMQTRSEAAGCTNDKQIWALSSASENTVANLLTKHRISADVSQFFHTLKIVIEEREHSKYQFSKHLNACIQLVKDYCQINNISTEDANYLDIQFLLKSFHIHNTERRNKEIIADIAKNKTAYDLNKYIILPDVIRTADEIFCFEDILSKPKFISTKVVTGNCKIINDTNVIGDLTNSIILIESADPGFDFIFDKKIKALITCYGGENSHMAIRCAELNLPAAIGVGPSLYVELSQHGGTVELDPQNRTIILL